MSDGPLYSNARAYLHDLVAVARGVDCGVIDLFSRVIFETWEQDGQALVFGNGGSATTASHFVTDLVKTAAVDGQRRLRAISLVENQGLTTAIANDLDYQQTFMVGLEAYARPGDIVIAISGSGNSENVVAACRWATAHNLKLVCLTGFDGGRIAELADIHVHVPSTNYGLIEDLHLAIGHMVSQALKARIRANAFVKT